MHIEGTIARLAASRLQLLPCLVCGASRRRGDDQEKMMKRRIISSSIAIAKSGTCVERRGAIRYGRRIKAAKSAIPGDLYFYLFEAEGSVPFIQLSIKEQEEESRRLKPVLSVLYFSECTIFAAIKAGPWQEVVIEEALRLLRKKGQGSWARHSDPTPR